MGTTISRELITASASATEKAGQQLARNLQPGDLVLLVGELGSGKTTLVRGIARGLAVKGDIASPTFQLVRLHDGSIRLAHLDLYRLDAPGEIEALGLDELLDDAVVVVEWGDRLRGTTQASAPGRRGEIRLAHVDPQRRRLRIESGPADWSF